MRCRIPDGQEKRAASFVAQNRQACPLFPARDRTAYRNASTRETYAPSSAPGHRSLGRSDGARSFVDRDYDALTPMLLEGFQARYDELSEAVAIIYANNFAPDDLHGLIAFYKSPAGQKFLQETPVVTQ
jgi:hypothetical protein